MEHFEHNGLSKFIVMVKDRKTGSRHSYYVESRGMAENKQAEILKELQERFEIGIYEKDKQE